MKGATARTFTALLAVSGAFIPATQRVQLYRSKLGGAGGLQKKLHTAGGGWFPGSCCSSGVAILRPPRAAASTVSHGVFGLGGMEVAVIVATGERMGGL